MTERPDRMSQIVWGMLAIVGAALAVVGWYHYRAQRRPDLPLGKSLNLFPEHLGRRGDHGRRRAEAITRVLMV